MEMKRSMRHWKLASLVVGMALLLTASPVLAGGTGAQSFTTHVQDVTETGADVNPCTGDPGILTQTYSGVFHITELANGTHHFTGTLRGTFTFDTDDPALPDYTGRFTGWFGENSNSRNYAATGTVTYHATGTDGSTFRFHVTSHVAVSATGAVVGFEKLHCA